MPNSTHGVNTEWNRAEKIPKLSAESNQWSMQIAWKNRETLHPRWLGENILQISAVWFSPAILLKRTWNYSLVIGRCSSGELTLPLLLQALGQCMGNQSHLQPLTKVSQQKLSAALYSCHISLVPPLSVSFHWFLGIQNHCAITRKTPFPLFCY